MSTTCLLSREGRRAGDRVGGHHHPGYYDLLGRHQSGHQGHLCCCHHHLERHHLDHRYATAWLVVVVIIIMAINIILVVDVISVVTIIIWITSQVRDCVEVALEKEVDAIRAQQGKMRDFLLQVISCLRWSQSVIRIIENEKGGKKGNGNWKMKVFGPRREKLMA